MNNSVLTLDELLIHIIRKPIKHMYLRITPPDGQVYVSIPLRANLELIRHHLKMKKPWILAKQARLRQSSLHLPMAEDMIPFLGKSYRLLISQGEKLRRLYLDDEHLHCLLPDKVSPNTVPQLIHAWYRQQLSALLPALISKWEFTMKVQVNTWGIRVMKTRWGSCNTRKGRICLNLNLIKKPLICIEYVLVHEMTHLLEANHSSRFYDLMTAFMPDWRAHHQLLEPSARLRS